VQHLVNIAPADAVLLLEAAHGRRLSRCILERPPGESRNARGRRRAACFLCRSTLTYVLARGTLDALRNSLHSIDVVLAMLPAAVRRVRRRGLKGSICLLYPIFHDTSGDDVLDDGDWTPHRLTITGKSSGRSLRRVMHISRGTPLPPPMHDPPCRPCVPAASRSAPAGLDLVDGVEDDHALADFRL